MKIDQVCQLLATIAPLNLAEDWDNVGLLLGDRHGRVKRVMTCLTVTPAVVDEVIREKVDLLVSHHPLPFQPMSRVTTDSAASSLVWRLCRAGVALYSAHTAYDSADGGINDQWATALRLSGVRPLNVFESEPSSAPEATLSLGSGRFGDLADPLPASELLIQAAELADSSRPRLAGNPNLPIRRLGIACGSGGSFVSSARRRGCDALLTGEATFHACLDAENTGMVLLMVGHYASERFAMESLATRLSSAIAAASPDAEMRVSASRSEADPITVDRAVANP
ncbi:MAG: Nif3-like dinuclear metal center hexameric protein [Planctomycetota bacterium]